MKMLTDSFGRQFSYLRLSVTDACNFRCLYCLPDGYKKPESAETDLSVQEIRNLVTAFAELGTWKVRLTGGEPTLRRDLPEIAESISAIPGIQRIALSTNGYRLKAIAKPLFEAGISALNISVDSLDRKRFEEITGADKLIEILSGIDQAFSVGYKSIKVNSVLLENWNEADFTLFLEWTRHTPVSVRFIELMPTAQNQNTFRSHHFKSGALFEKLLQDGWRPRTRVEGDGPAVEFEKSNHVGKIGIIAPYSQDFCKSCNRLRVTCKGALRLCLFAEGEFSLRDLLQRPDQKETLKARLQSLLQKKEVSHYLPNGTYGNNTTFSAMGG